MNITVSVLMPVYNGLPLIKASIESLKKQTFTEWECIIVDDGSTDGTSDFLDELEDSRFIVRHLRTNMGRPFARQRTIELCRGEYISFLDAGDLYSPDKLDTQLRYLRDNPEVALVSCSMCSFGTKTDALRIRGVLSPEIVVFDGTRYPNFASSMIRSSRAKQYAFNPSIKLGEDKDYLGRFLFDQKFLEIPETLYYYSEFDSVTKKKIRKTYLFEIRKGFHDASLFLVCKGFFKLLYSWVVYPFMKTESIVVKRGRELNEKELKLYKTDCFAIVESILP